MSILLDTHIVLWQFLDDPRLTSRHRALLLDTNIEKVVSDLSLWEIVMKMRAGKLRGSLDRIKAEIARSGYAWLSIDRAHIAAAVSLPQHHGDPFDHLLIAQAVVEGLRLLTNDSWFEQYPVALA